MLIEEACSSYAAEDNPLLEKLDFGVKSNRPLTVT